VTPAPDPDAPNHGARPWPDGLDPTDWVYACEAPALESAPRAVGVAGRPVVVWRTATGRVCALADSCPHQGTELSLGVVVGEELVCSKHGWSVATDGWCDRAGAGTAAYSVREIDGAVYVRSPTRP